MQVASINLEILFVEERHIYEKLQEQLDLNAFPMSILLFNI